MSRYPSDKAIKAQALWDMSHACQITGCHLPDELGIPDDVWLELMDTEGIHEPHWEERIRKGRVPEDQTTLDDYYEFHQQEHKRRLETVDKFQE